MRVLEHLLLFGTAFAAVEYLSSTSSTVTSSSSSTSAGSVTQLVWSTNAAGAASQVAYTQNFEPMWTTINTPPAGTIGLGDIDGEVGTTRTGYATPADGSVSLVTGVSTA